MERLELGQVLPQFIGVPEQAFFNIDDNGAILTVIYKNPDDHEIAQFQEKMPFEMREILLGDVIMTMFKIGDLNWIDAPFSPHLSEKLTKLDMPNELQGMNLIIVFVDSSNGEIKSLRLIGMSNNFTKSLYRDIYQMWMKEFDRTKYNSDLQEIYAKYTTKELSKMAANYFQVKG